MKRTAKHKPPGPETIDALVRIVGASHAIRDEAEMAPYLVEWRDRYRGKAALVLKPGDTGEVSSILKLANETMTAIVPQGGNTGLVGGQIPFESGHEVVVSLERLTHVRDIDLADAVEAIERENDLAVMRNLSADETGIAALRHDRGAGRIRQFQNLGNFGHRARPQHHRRVSAEHVAHLDQIRHLLRRIGDGEFVADDRREARQEIGRGWRP